MKVFYLEGCTSAVPYDKEQHGKLASTFLYWRDVEGEELLIVGEYHSHRSLFSEASCPDNILPHLNYLPDGAGRARESRISGWSGDAFDVVTPNELKPIIREALGLQE